jgi:hypothetical protein
MEEKYICADCIAEDYLGAYIEQEGSSQICSYCKKEKKVIELERIYGLIEDGLNFLYIDSSEAEESLINPVMEADEVLAKHITSEQPIIDDLLSYFDDQSWCERGISYGNESEITFWTWQKFTDLIKYKARFFFMEKNFDVNYGYLPLPILQQINIIAEKLDLFTILPKGTTVYRARKGCYNKASELGSAPSAGIKYSNRFSPAGISMFYGAEDKETCLTEIEIDVSSKYTIGKWELQEDLCVLDFTKYFKVDEKTNKYYSKNSPSIFDKGRRNEYHYYVFIQMLASDMSKSVSRDGSENIDYVPTQVVCEYFRLVKKNIMGICFYSAKNGRKNYCLFYDNKDCADESKIKPLEIEAVKISVVPRCLSATS